jgi:hypothetical protein
MLDIVEELEELEELMLGAADEATDEFACKFVVVEAVCRTLSLDEDLVIIFVVELEVLTLLLVEFEDVDMVVEEVSIYI